MKDSNKIPGKELDKMKDSAIDYSEIPATDFDFWEDAVAVYPQKKVTVEMQIDEDLALWLKELGNESDVAINNLLRSYFIGTKRLLFNK